MAPPSTFCSRQKRRRTDGPAGGRAEAKRSAQYHCNYCAKDISGQVRIKCAVCPDFDLCLDCFRVGAEVRGNGSGGAGGAAAAARQDAAGWRPHLNDHAYRVVDNLSFPLYHPAWGADEELLLLEGVDMCGLGNWQAVADHVGQKQAEECRSHYYQVYVDTGGRYPHPRPAPEMEGVNPRDFVHSPIRFQELQRSFGLLRDAARGGGVARTLALAAGPPADAQQQQQPAVGVVAPSATAPGPAPAAALGAAPAAAAAAAAAEAATTAAAEAMAAAPTVAVLQPHVQLQLMSAVVGGGYVGGAGGKQGPAAAAALGGGEAIGGGALQPEVVGGEVKEEEDAVAGGDMKEEEQGAVVGAPAAEDVRPAKRTKVETSNGRAVKQEDVGRQPQGAATQQQQQQATGGAAAAAAGAAAAAAKQEDGGQQAGPESDAAAAAATGAAAPAKPEAEAPAAVDSGTGAAAASAGARKGASKGAALRGGDTAGQQQLEQQAHPKQEGGGGVVPSTPAPGGKTLRAGNVEAPQAIKFGYGLVEVTTFNVKRDEFEHEYDNDAELMLADMDFRPEDSPREVAAKQRLLAIYNARLDERQRRREFIKRYGLLNVKAMQGRDKRRSPSEREMHARLRCFARYLPPERLHALAEGLLAEQRLRQRIAELQVYRRSGVRTLSEADEYEARTRRRAAAEERADQQRLVQALEAQLAGDASKQICMVKAVVESMFGSGRQLQRCAQDLRAQGFGLEATTAALAAAGPGAGPGATAVVDATSGGKGGGAGAWLAGWRNRRGVGLDITWLPGQEHLTRRERELCSALRLLPAHYLLIKGVMMRESARGEPLTRQEARNYLRLDPQRALRCYDLLLSQGWIPPPRQQQQQLAAAGGALGGVAAAAVLPAAASAADLQRLAAADGKGVAGGGCEQQGSPSRADVEDSGAAAMDTS